MLLSFNGPGPDTPRMRVFQSLPQGYAYICYMRLCVGLHRVWGLWGLFKERLDTTECLCMLCHFHLLVALFSALAKYCRLLFLSIDLCVIALTLRLQAEIVVVDVQGSSDLWKKSVIVFACDVYVLCLLPASVCVWISMVTSECQNIVDMLMWSLTTCKRHMISSFGVFCNWTLWMHHCDRLPENLNTLEKQTKYLWHGQRKAFYQFTVYC